MVCTVFKTAILPLAKVRLEGHSAHSDLGQLQGKKGFPELVQTSGFLKNDPGQSDISLFKCLWIFVSPTMFIQLCKCILYILTLF